MEDTNPDVAAEQTLEQAPDTQEQHEPTEEPQEEVKQEQTVGELLNTEPKNSIPESAFLNEKNGRKAAEKRVKELEALVQQGASKEEVSDEIDSILSKYDLDDTNRDFYKEITQNLYKKAERLAEERVASKLAPLEEKERSERIDQVFKKHYGEAIEQFPELKGVANPEVVKSWSLDPRNSHKTFTQLIDEIYGSIPQGRRTIETVRPGGTKEPEPIDYKRAEYDMAYLENILGDPIRKEEYNSNFLTRNRRMR